MKFMFDIHESLRWKSQPVSQGAMSPCLPLCLARQEPSPQTPSPDSESHLKSQPLLKPPGFQHLERCAAGWNWLQLAALHPEGVFGQTRWEQLWPWAGGPQHPPALPGTPSSQISASLWCGHCGCTPVPFMPLLTHLITALCAPHPSSAAWLNFGEK